VPGSNQQRELGRHAIAWRLAYAVGAVLFVVGLVSVARLRALLETYEGGRGREGHA
jgi:hypothetical protein